jgi:hypothetical protein
MRILSSSAVHSSPEFPPPPMARPDIGIGAGFFELTFPLHAF